MNTPSLEEATKLAERRLTRARTQMLLDNVNGRYPFIFWATAALHLKLQAVPGLGQLASGDVGTDGDHLFYDPLTFYDPAKYSDRQLLSIIAHEVSHCVKGDVWRIGSRDHTLFNIACDMRIDPEIIAAGFEPPEHGSAILNTLFHNAANNGRSAEELYEELKKNPPDCRRQSSSSEAASLEGTPVVGTTTGTPVVETPGQGTPAGAPGDRLGGDLREPAAKAAADKKAALEDLARKWEIIARQAAEIAKAQGHLPAGYAYLVAPVRPKLNPWDLIAHYVSMCRHDDFSWARPNRRSLWRGMALPTLRSEGIGTLVIGIDTSSSCARAIPTFLGFLASVLDQVQPERTVFIECDAAVHALTEYAPGDELPSAFPVHGYGGTSMAPIWAAVEERNIDPVCAIVMTDLMMCGGDFGSPQPFPVLWLSSVPGAVAPWGETADLA